MGPFVVPATTIAMAVSMLLVIGGCIRAGIIPFVVFPKLDSRTIDARVAFPDGTPGRVTDQALEKVEQALQDVDRELGGGLIRHRYRMAGWTTPPSNASALGGAFEGGHLGLVNVELTAPEDRHVQSEEILERWRSTWNDSTRHSSRGSRACRSPAKNWGRGERRSSSNCFLPPMKTPSGNWKRRWKSVRPSWRTTTA